MKSEYVLMAVLIKRVALQAGDERASKCGYDLMHAINDGTSGDIRKAWERFLEEEIRGEVHIDTERHGAWVPSVAL